jgi:hypothetical protein
MVVRRQTSSIGLRALCGVLVLAAAVVGAVALGRPAAAAEPVWATGPALGRRLAAPVAIVWSGNPLRPALRGLARAEHVAIVLDRRVDPDQHVELKLSAVPLAEALRKIAQDRHLGVAMLGPVAYFGPPEAAARLRTLATSRQEEVRRLGSTTARRLLQERSLAWEDFATPRAILARLADEAGVEIDGLAEVPHDLWAAAEMPPLGWVDRLTLIANQFDLTFQVASDGRRVQLVPVPTTPTLLRSYPAGLNAGRLAKRFQTLAPEAEIKIAGDKIWVRARLEDHERIAAPNRPVERAEPPLRPPKTPGPQMVARLNVQEKPLDKVLERLATEFNFQLKMDAQALKAAGIAPDQRVSIQVENATLDDALRELLRTTPLTYRRRGNVVEIIPK